MTKHFTFRLVTPFRQHCFISDDHKVSSILRNHHRRQNYTHCTEWCYFRSVLCIYKLCTLVHVSAIFLWSQKGLQMLGACSCAHPLQYLHVYMCTWLEVWASLKQNYPVQGWHTPSIHLAVDWTWHHFWIRLFVTHQHLFTSHRMGTWSWIAYKII